MVQKFVFRHDENENRVNAIRFSSEFINYLFPRWKKQWKMFLQYPYYLSQKYKNHADSFLIQYLGFCAIAQNVDLRRNYFL